MVFSCPLPPAYSPGFHGGKYLLCECWTPKSKSLLWEAPGVVGETGQARITASETGRHMQNSKQCGVQR